MTGAAARAAGVALGVSLAVHGVVLVWIAPASGGTETPPGVAGLSMIGQSFEDLAAGSIAPVESDPDTTRPTPPDTVTPALATTSPPVTGSRVSPAVPVSAVAASPIAATPATTATDVAAPVTERTTARDAPAVLQPTEDTPRPPARPSRPAPVAVAPPPLTVPQGTAEVDARAGAAEGRTEGTAPQRQGDTDAAPGPTAREIARYPQQVNRHLGRLRRPASEHRGTAVIAFAIAPDGGLSSISLAQSSGDASFDDLALRHVRSAVPFPAPPAGAQTSYSVSVRGR
jgi:protein TonB